MMRAPHRFRGLAGLLCIAGAVVAHAQDSAVNPHTGVRGKCVSNCNIPNAPQPRQQGQYLDPRLYWIGMSVEVQGEVTLVYPNGQRVQADAIGRTPVPYGARVLTGPTARLRILLADETSFTVGPSSETVLDEFVFDPREEVSRISVRVVKGQFRFVTGRPVRRRDASVGTPVGTVGGFRGTQVEVNVDPSGSGYIANIDGEFDVTEYDTARVITLRAGQRLLFENFAIVGVQ